MEEEGLPSTTSSRLRILSFNVNGLRAILKRLYGPTATITTLLNDVGKHADIVCLQETKLRSSELAVSRELALAEGWDSFFSCADSSRGYSGVATFCRTGVCLPFAAHEGFTSAQTSEAPGCSTLETLPSEPHADLITHFSPQELASLDSEGRVVVTDHGAFVLWNIYGPAISSEDPEQAQLRMEYKMKFYSALEWRWAGLLSRGRPIIAVGDFNIAPQPIDYPDHDPDFFRSSRQDRLWMRRILSGNGEAGAPPFVDCFRAFHPQRRSAFTVWSVATGARANNYGSRIDLCLAAGLPFRQAEIDLEKDEDAADDKRADVCWIHASDIEPDVQGSDHCPVWVDVGYPSSRPFPCAASAPPCAMRYALVGKQTKLHSWLAQGSSERAPNVEASEGGEVPRGGEPTSIATAIGEKKPKQLSLKAFFAGRKQDGDKCSSQAPEDADLNQGDQNPHSKRAGEHIDSEIETTLPSSIPSSLNVPLQPPAARSSFLEAELAATASLREKQLAEAKDAWQRIQQRQQVPRCKHGDPAALKRVNKSGPNNGRYFYMCSRPAGKGPQAQCSFFQWVEKKPGDAPGRPQNSFNASGGPGAGDRGGSSFHDAEAGAKKVKYT